LLPPQLGRNYFRTSRSGTGFDANRTADPGDAEAGVEEEGEEEAEEITPSSAFGTFFIFSTSSPPLPLVFVGEETNALSRYEGVVTDSGKTCPRSCEEEEEGGVAAAKGEEGEGEGETEEALTPSRIARILL
jgi:hypothetical protein